MKRIALLCVLVVIVSCQFVFASGSDKWEYMVVSFGKADFSQEISKTMAYWDDGISKVAYGASSYENNLDILGQHGWEATSILGAIGGDQQVMLKRLYDKNRTDAEVKEIAENSVLAAQVLFDYLVAATTKELELIELDAYEADLQRQKNADAYHQMVDDYFNSLTKNKPGAWTVNYYEYEFSPSDLIITYDITKDYLLNTNSYRKSQVKAFLNSLESMLSNMPLPTKVKKLDIKITANIIYSGKTFKVGSASYLIDPSASSSKNRKLKIE
jgi:hypothetical protein